MLQAHEPAFGSVKWNWILLILIHAFPVIDAVWFYLQNASSAAGPNTSALSEGTSA
jgi:hypothetical protein